MTLRLLGWLAITTLLVLGPAPAGASHLKEQPRKHRVVYHLSEAGVDKARFVLGNIHNTITGVGGPGHVEAIELVVHGPALKTFVVASMDPQLKAMLSELQGLGLAFGACGNTDEGVQPDARGAPQGRPAPAAGRRRAHLGAARAGVRLPAPLMLVEYEGCTHADGEGP
jgi:intracellular sulfur oxidation DsrE/DsrF family protein